MSNKCCCIIPLRGGVIISGLIMLVISLALLGATFTHKNPLVIHLSITSVILPWVYLGFLIATALVSLFLITSGFVGKLNVMRISRFLIWSLLFFLTIWEAISFILSLTNRSRSLTECRALNPETTKTTPATSSSNTTITVGDYSTTFLGMQVGNTYGLANCDQAVQADVIGNAILLFFGQLFMLYAAIKTGSYTNKLKERKVGHRLRDIEWEDDLNELYKSDARNAPKYNVKKQKKFMFWKK